MKMNQWVDFDTGDEAQSENVFSYIPEFGISDCRFSCYARFPIGAY